MYVIAADTSVNFPVTLGPVLPALSWSQGTVPVEKRDIRLALSNSSLSGLDVVYTCTCTLV